MLMKAVTVGGGGGGTQINLWTIPSKSSVTTGAITLSDAIENYEEVIITYRNSTTDAFERSIRYKVSEVMTDSYTKYVYFGGYDGSKTYERYVTFSGGTSANIGNCYQVGNTGRFDNGYYPVSIDGFK